MESRTLGEQALVDETRNDVTVLEAVVVVRAKDVGRDRGREVAAEFLVVRAGAMESDKNTMDRIVTSLERKRTGCKRPRDAFHART